MENIDFKCTKGDIIFCRYKNGEYKLESPVLEQPLLYTFIPWDRYRLIERGELCDIYIDLYRGCYDVFITDILIKSNFNYIKDARTFIQKYKLPEPLPEKGSLASFKRDVTLPGFTLTRIVNGEKCIKTVCHVQTNAIALLDPVKPSGKSWLFLPPASLLEYNKKKLRIYEPARRFYNKKEIEASMLWESQRNPKAYELGGNAEFYREKAFWEGQGMEYMFGMEKKCGMRKNNNDHLITDAHFKGNLILEYEVHLI